MPDSAWEIKQGFMVTEIPDALIDRDPYLKAVKQVYEVMQVLVYLPPYTCYPWHRDENRRTIINMPLNAHASSSCVFTKDLKAGEFFEFTELKYEPQTYYLFNTQEDHMVLN